MFSGALKWTHCKPILMIQAKELGDKELGKLLHLFTLPLDFAKQIQILADTAKYTAIRDRIQIIVFDSRKRKLP